MSNTRQDFYRHAQVMTENIEAEALKEGWEIHSLTLALHRHEETTINVRLRTDLGELINRKIDVLVADEVKKHYPHHSLNFC
jgi:hypothetical protein